MPKPDKRAEPVEMRIKSNGELIQKMMDEFSADDISFSNMRNIAKARRARAAIRRWATTGAKPTAEQMQEAVMALDEYTMAVLHLAKMEKETQG